MNELADSFYLSSGEVFEATPLTAGPWDAALQHAGPPAALMARALKDLPAPQPRRIASITCDILRPIPVGPVTVKTRVVRSGANTDLVEGALHAHQGEMLMLARAWRLADEAIALPDLGATAAYPPSFDNSRSREFFPVPHEVGYHTATEWRFAHGGWLEPGPAMAWMRMLVALVDDEEPSHIERLLVAADSTSGVSAALNPLEFFFMNVDLRVQVGRASQHEWIGIEASSEFQDARIAFAHGRLFDLDSVVGSATQTLLISKRNDSGATP